MAITFHCAHCGKKIEAQDKAAGKWGTCPSCHNKVYVPDIHAKGDFKLTPIDDEEEARRQAEEEASMEARTEKVREFADELGRAVENLLKINELTTDETNVNI